MSFVPLVTSPQFLPYAMGIAAVLGACIGSFISLITYRLPLEQKVGATRSRCPQCLHALTPRDLVPVLSWTFSRGRCRHCRVRVSIRYPLTELASALGAVAVIGYLGVTWQALAVCGLWWCIVAIVVTDLEHYIILDEVQLATGAFGLLYGWAGDAGWWAMSSGALVGLLIGLALKYGFIYLRNKDGLGMGDVKFLAMAGIWLADGANFVPFLFFAGVLGVASGMVWRLLGLGERFPFGPALAFALLACVISPGLADGFWTLYGFAPSAASQGG